MQIRYNITKIVLILNAIELHVSIVIVALIVLLGNIIVAVVEFFFCDNCSDNIAIFLPRNINVPVRLCDNCYSLHNIDSSNMIFTFGRWFYRSLLQGSEEYQNFMFLFLLTMLERESESPIATITPNNLDKYIEIGWKSNDMPTICSVCQIEMTRINDPNNIVCRLPCKHMYHKDCISEWLTKYSGACPLCRRTLNIDGYE